MYVNKININQTEPTYDIASDAYDITYEDSNVGQKLSELENSVDNLEGIEYQGEYRAYQDIAENINIPNGTTFVNNGVAVLLSNNSSFSDYKIVRNKETWVSTINVKFIRTYNKAGNVDLSVIGKIELNTKSIYSLQQRIDGISASGVVNNTDNLVIRNISIKKGQKFDIIYNSSAGGRVIVTTDFGGQKKLSDSSSLNNVKKTYIADEEIIYLLLWNYSRGQTEFTVNVYVGIPTLEGRVEKLEEGIIPDESISFSNLDDEIKEVVVSKNLFDKNAVGIINDAFWTNSVNNGFPSYFVSDAIKVKPNTTYCISRDGALQEERFIAELAEKGSTNSLKYQENKSTFTTGSDTNYIRVSFYSTHKKYNLQIEEGDTPTEYAEYIDSYSQVRLRDKQVTKEKLAENIIVDRKFESLKLHGNVASNGLLTSASIDVSKNFVLVAQIKGMFESVKVGLGKDNYFGMWVEITPTKLIITRGNAQSSPITKEHGLTLDDRTIIKITHGYTSSAFISLINGSGEKMEDYEVTWGISVGKAFVLNNSNSAIETTLDFMPMDLNEKIWMFGDSYFAYNDASRWVYYLLNDGHSHNLINAMSGENPTEALESLNTLLSTGSKPLYIVWCMGMNNSNDNNAINAEWLRVESEVIKICNRFGIIPILATIPTVPNINHSYKNEWIRNSGYRYIDFASSVEVEGTKTWRGYGTEKAMLSSDNIHPTRYGSIALYGQAMTDFPEITNLV